MARPPDGQAAPTWVSRTQRFLQCGLYLSQLLCELVLAMRERHNAFHADEALMRMKMLVRMKGIFWSEVYPL